MGPFSIPWIIYVCIWNIAGMKLMGEMEGLGEKPVPFPLFLLQIPHALPWE
jgi:hypothetical protein